MWSGRERYGITGSIRRSIERRNTAGPEVSAAHILEILSVLAVSAVHKPKQTGGNEVRAVGFSQMFKSTSQVPGASARKITKIRITKEKQ